MKPGQQSAGACTACESCRRRGWLLSALTGPLDCVARDGERLIDVLTLTDHALLQAVAGRRTCELRDRYERLRDDELVSPPNVQSTCRHRRGYPDSLDGVAEPPMLEVVGGTRRLAQLTATPVVAIVGSRSATDYGMEMARALARGLVASGLAITAGLTDGIAAAAHAGAQHANSASIAVMSGGLGVSVPARRRSLYERITQSGCAVSQLPWDCHGRRWGRLAGERIIVGLAHLVVLVEARDTPGDLAAARLARALGRPLAAIPGRVTSPLSRGTHREIKDGAKLVSGPQDVLELLYSSGQEPREGSTPPEPHTALEPRLQRTLERVGSGLDTLHKLARDGTDVAELLLALSELELLGLLARGDGGRYVPRQPLPGVPANRATP